MRWHMARCKFGRSRGPVVCGDVGAKIVQASPALTRPPRPCSPSSGTSSTPSPSTNPSSASSKTPSRRAPSPPRATSPGMSRRTSPTCRPASRRPCVCVPPSVSTSRAWSHLRALSWTATSSPAAPPSRPTAGCCIATRRCLARTRMTLGRSAGLRTRSGRRRWRGTCSR